MAKKIVADAIFNEENQPQYQDGDRIVELDTDDNQFTLTFFLDPKDDRSGVTLRLDSDDFRRQVYKILGSDHVPV